MCDHWLLQALLPGQDLNAGEEGSADAVAALQAAAACNSPAPEASIQLGCARLRALRWELVALQDAFAQQQILRQEQQREQQQQRQLADLFDDDPLAEGEQQSPQLQHVLATGGAHQKHQPRAGQGEEGPGAPCSW